jgi:PAS domain S-box-containing protein
MSRKPVRGAARLAAILDALPDALLLVDASNTIVNANAMALELFETGGSPLLGLSLHIILPGFGRGVTTAGGQPRMLEAAEGDDAERPATASARRTPPERLAARRTDGTAFPVEATSASLPDDDSVTLLIVRDLSGSLDVETELRRQQRQTELILRAAAEGIIGVDTTGQIVLVNPAAARILRYRAGDLGGQDLHQLIAYARADGTPVDADECAPLEALRTGRRHKLRGEALWRKDGTSVSVDLTTAPVLENDVLVGAVITFTDTSELRALARRNEELVDVLDAELRRPLAVVGRELSALAEQGLGEVGPSARRSLAHLAEELDRAGRMLSDAVDYQRLAVSDEPFERTTTDLRTIVLAAVDAVRDAATTGGLDLSVHAEQAPLWGDETWLVKAVGLLLLDTVTASPRGTTVLVAAASRGGMARVEIRGPLSGAGGLRLPIARGIVERHSGTVTTHRITGKGHTYVVELPVDPRQYGGGARTTEQSNQQGLRSGQLRAALPARGRRHDATGHDEATGGVPAGVGATSSGQAIGTSGPVVRTNGHGTQHGAQARKLLETSPAPIPRQAPPAETRRPPETTDDRDEPVDGPGVRRTTGSDTGPGRAMFEDATVGDHSFGRAPRPVPPTEPRSSRPADDDADGPPDDEPPFELTGQHTIGGAATQTDAATQTGATAADRLDLVDATAMPAEPRGRRRATSTGEMSALERSAEPAATTSPATSGETRTQRSSARPEPAPTLDDDAGDSLAAPARRVHVADEVTDAASARVARPVPGLTPADAAGLGGVAEASPRTDETGPDDALPPESTPASGGGRRRGRPVRASAIVDDVPDAAPNLPAARRSVAPLRPTRRLLIWPKPDPTTSAMLVERGYQPLALPASEPSGTAGHGGSHRLGAAASGVGPGAAAPKAADISLLRSVEPLALFVDPVAAPITRSALRELRVAATDARVPVLVTVGLAEGAPNAGLGPAPAVLIRALTTQQETARVLVVDEQLEVATALSASLTRSGIEVLHAASESDAVATAATMPPDLIALSINLVRRRRVGLIDWLRSHERLHTTPIVVYTTAGLDETELSALRLGESALYLSERAGDEETRSRLVDLISKIAVPS